MGNCGAVSDFGTGVDVSEPEKNQAERMVDGTDPAGTYLSTPFML